MSRKTSNHHVRDPQGRAQDSNDYSYRTSDSQVPGMARTSSSDRSTQSSSASLYPAMQSFETSIAAAARIPEEPDTSLGMTIDDDFIQQQEAIMRDFLKARDQEECKPPSRASPLATRDSHCSLASVVTPPSHDIDVSSREADLQDFCEYLNDPELIREQRRIFQGIQRQQEEAASAATLDANTSSHSSADRLAHQVLEASLRHGPVRQAAKQDQMAHSKRSSTTDDNVVAASQDRVTRLGDGSTLRVKGTRHAYQSIARGTAIIVTCPGCQTVLQVDESTKLVYCMRCQQVSPIELARNGGASPYAENRDSAIAGSVQQQEIDVACARKLSKMDRPRR